MNDLFKQDDELCWKDLVRDGFTDITKEGYWLLSRLCWLDKHRLQEINFVIDQRILFRNYSLHRSIFIFFHIVSLWFKFGNLRREKIIFPSSKIDDSLRKLFCRHLFYLKKKRTKNFYSRLLCVVSFQTGVSEWKKKCGVFPFKELKARTC